MYLLLAPLFSAYPHTLAGCGPRNMYVDLGASWCNTLQLHTQLEEAAARSGPWMVFAFEAAPLIAPYLESCAVELAAGRPIPPAPVPPTGSLALDHRRIVTRPAAATEYFMPRTRHAAVTRAVTDAWLHSSPSPSPRRFHGGLPRVCALPR